jgi:hypothetical protein
MMNKYEVLHDEKGKTLIQLKDGLEHCETGPAIEVYDGPHKGTEKWFIDGMRHREDGPAEIDIVDLGILGKGILGKKNCRIKWYVNDILHRADGPAHTEIWHYGNAGVSTPAKVEKWYLDGRRHRDGGPAIILDEPHHKEVSYYKLGKRHRLDGPAVIKRFYNGLEVYWCKSGVTYSDKFKWLEALSKADRAKMLLSEAFFKEWTIDDALAEVTYFKERDV